MDQPPPNNPLQETMTVYIWLKALVNKTTLQCLLKASIYGAPLTLLGCLFHRAGMAMEEVLAFVGARQATLSVGTASRGQPEDRSWHMGI